MSPQDVSPLPSPCFGRAPSRPLTLSSGMRFLCTLRGTDDAQKTHTLNLTSTTRVGQLSRVTGSTPIQVFRHTCNALEQTHQT